MTDRVRSADDDAAAAPYLGATVVTDEVKGLFARQNGLQTVRGLGILLVVIHHMTGGLTNAAAVFDAFFVISGYLISIRLIVLARTANVRDYFLTFYKFRIRRILPVALLTLALTAIAANLIYLPGRAHETTVDVLWATFFMANVHFAQTRTDYFAQGGAISPVLNFWSLSVEEQFYLVWPLVILIALLVARRRGRGTGVAPVALVIIVLSFSYGWWASVNDPVTAYYSTLARVWDFGIGALMASFAVGQAHRESFSSDASPRAVPLIVRINRRLVPHAGRIAWLGVVLVVLAMAYTPSHLGYPVPAASFGMVGMGVVFYANTLQRDPSWLFANARPLIWLGDISYSLYVVHLPIVVFASSYIDNTTTLYAFDIAASLCVATLMYNFVERPARQSWSRNRDWFRTGGHQAPLMQAAVFGVAAAILFAGAARAPVAPAPIVDPISSQEESSEPPPADLGGLFPDATLADVPPDILKVALRTPRSVSESHFVTPTTELGQAIQEAAALTEWPTLSNEARVGRSEFAEECEVRDAVHTPCVAEPVNGVDTTKVAVAIGDSTILTYWPMLRDALVPHGWTVVMYGQGFCPAALANLGGATGDLAACSQHHDGYDTLLTTWEPTLVFTSDAEGSPYIVSDGSRAGRMPITSSPDAYERALSTAVTEFRDTGARVVMLSPPPMRKPMGTCAVAGSSPQDCVSPVTGLWPTLNAVNQRISASTGADYADLLPFFCHELRCPAVVDGVVVAADFVHVTPEYAAMLAPSFEQYLLRERLLQ